MWSWISMPTWLASKRSVWGRPRGKVGSFRALTALFPLVTAGRTCGVEIYTIWRGTLFCNLPVLSVCVQYFWSWVLRRGVILCWHTVPTTQGPRLSFVKQVMMSWGQNYSFPQLVMLKDFSTNPDNYPFRNGRSSRFFEFGHFWLVS